MSRLARVFLSDPSQVRGMCLLTAKSASSYAGAKVYLPADFAGIYGDSVDIQQTRSRDISLIRAATQELGLVNFVFFDGSIDRHPPFNEIP